MLSSMFPSSEEFFLDNPAILSDVEDWIKKFEMAGSMVMPTDYHVLRPIGCIEELCSWELTLLRYFTLATLKSNSYNHLSIGLLL